MVAEASRRQGVLVALGDHVAGLRGGILDGVGDGVGVMVATVTPLGGVQVIVVPDDNKDARNIPPGILAMLGPDTVLMSNDSLRCYVRQSHWEAMKEGFTLVTK